ncbi:MAG: hypothetical protein Unbinned4120contig1000_23 [Prokaryotic dsDNA virus sp.]|jgi:hypothetical protein|nr:MAG: hypothetical protein Unbinned4120contig1000_23 [Prokaryotic dsDNA virus sp.]|tara:strand:+ start:40335 stop:41129 length:795 start_codon:yes stop_codon:yes gene_type:complete
MSNLTLQEVQAAAPANMKKAVTQEMVDDINGASNDPEIARMIGDNFISFVGVMKEGRFKIEDYLSAVTYVSHKLMGDSNKEAWCKTFPQRHAALTSAGADSKTISAHVASYSKGKLVNMVLEQSMVPSWVLNAHLFQEALNTQADLMQNANSEKVRSDAANSILTHLKRPEAVKGQIDLNVKDSSGMNELREVLGDLAAQQRQAIAQGAPIREITDARIIKEDDVPGETIEHKALPVPTPAPSAAPIPAPSKQPDGSPRESLFR